jgi:hypothetical protein
MLIKFYIKWVWYISTWKLRIRTVEQRRNNEYRKYHSIRIGPLWIKWFVNPVT